MNIHIGESDESTSLASALCFRLGVWTNFKKHNLQRKVYGRDSDAQLLGLKSQEEELVALGVKVLPKQDSWQEPFAWKESKKN